MQIHSKINKVEFQSLFKTYYSPLCAFAHRILKNKSEAEEVVQQVFINIWDKRKQIKIDVSYQSYLHRAVRNTCLNHLKKERTRDKHESDSFEGYFDQTDMRYSDPYLGKIISDAIDTLPDRCKMIFELNRFEGMSYQQAADHLQLSIKTVENQIGKALKILRAELKIYEDHK